jgi:hypothetical protein
MTRRRRLCLLGGAALAAACFAAGCGGKYTKQKFETIYVGMPDHAVRHKLGAPQERSPSRWVYTGRRPYYRAEILFSDGKAVEKTWTCERPGKKPSPPQPDNDKPASTTPQ